MPTYEIDYSVTAYMLCRVHVDANSKEEARKIVEDTYDAPFDEWDIDYEDFEICQVSEIEG